MTAQALARDDLGALFDALRAEGYRVVGPTLRDDAIVLADLRGPEDLPAGWTVRQGPGTYRVERRDDEALFGFAVGQHSWKGFLFPSRERLVEMRREDGALEHRPAARDAAPLAFLGVRGCDLAAIEVQDRTFMRGRHVDPGYDARRRAAFVVAVDCLEAGDLCFCASMGTGPGVERGFDLRLTELGPRFLVAVGSARGASVAARLPLRAAPAGDERRRRDGLDDARAHMGRTMQADDLPGLLFGNLDHPRWDDVAARCLACANCTLVCPTCFCFSVETVSDLSGTEARRDRAWDSCFTVQHGQIHGATFRPRIKDRYRQWLTHKLGAWVSQFGVSGCTGCGRCIAWCPVGIDLTEEVAAIRATSRPAVAMPPPPAPAPAVREPMVPATARVTAVRRETDDVVTLRIAHEIAFRPGQFHMLGLPAIGEVPISIAGGDGRSVDHTIRAVGAVSGALAALEPGHALGIRGPFGSAWPLEACVGRPVVVVAGGVGLAPLRAALDTMAARPLDYPSVRLLYGARTPADLLFTDDLQRWAADPRFAVRVTVDHAGADWRGDVGVVTRLITDVPPDAVALVCGPEMMMGFSVRALCAAGLPAERAYVSMERNMACAVAHCGRCQLGPYFVCRDGPVFRFDRIARLFDQEGF